MFFESWSGLGRVLVVGVLAYGALVFVLRVSGKRTLSKMNAFDLIVTVALGSTIATVSVPNGSAPSGGEEQHDDKSQSEHVHAKHEHTRGR
jgi:hypothetical protein